MYLCYAVVNESVPYELLQGREDERREKTMIDQHQEEKGKDYYK
jgi:hypothetical protein